MALTSHAQPARHDMATVAEYRLYCRALCIVVLNHWSTLSQADSFSAAVERLMHPTAKNPNPKHRYFAKRFYKFPSYLRHSAIEFAKGQVSSYLTRYNQWLGGDRPSRTIRPPVFNPVSGCYPVMYRGQQVKFDENYTVASLKLWDGKEWLWHEIPIRKVRDRHLLGTMKSPSLVIHRRCHLSVPVAFKPTRLPDADRLCAVDIGINTLATASIVSSNGTVAARAFIHPAADIDRRHKRGVLIRRHARKTARLSEGFCRHWHRKAKHINQQIAQSASRRLVNFALEQQAHIIVLENLKGWRPKAGSRRSPLRQRFHGWLHRRLAELIEQKFIEHGGKVVYVYARGTSSWAYDDSGKLKRDPKHYEQATFATGKRYHCDLNASYNIAARYWAMRLKLTHRKDGQVSDGKSSSGTSRIPITLSTLWANAQGRGAGSPLSCTA